ncbi:FIST N-terminal domain-containing protein [Lishizhenia sp.]|uniref:FIST N-terminal domain-containing protein n=1 Tax=Lishizhenia sp. TaxID=2497594 RepID=UPI00299DA687|nr:FIST N-terminal domain-containing protein [Lishizhenia sp.]MDX1445311.1 FIST N-terminal domain-containing protein [Lishizhenia sp.]
MIHSNEFTLPELKECSAMEHQLVFVFGYREQFENEFEFALVREKFPNAQIVTTSTAGHIKGNKFSEEIAISAHRFDHTQIKAFSKNATEEGLEVSKKLIEDIPEEGLKGLLIIADNTFGNSADLISELNNHYKGGINIFGGLAGNMDLRVPSISGLNEAPSENNVIAIALYGEELSIKTNKVITAKGFGLDFTVSDYNRNVLLGLNGKSAYDVLYKLLDAESPQHFEEKIMLYPFL